MRQSPLPASSSDRSVMHDWKECPLWVPSSHRGPIPRAAAAPSPRSAPPASAAPNTAGTPQTAPAAPPAAATGRSAHPGTRSPDSQPFHTALATAPKPSLPGSRSRKPPATSPPAAIPAVRWAKTGWNVKSTSSWSSIVERFVPAALVLRVSRRISLLTRSQAPLQRFELPVYDITLGHTDDEDYRHIPLNLIHDAVPANPDAPGSVRAGHSPAPWRLRIAGQALYVRVDAPLVASRKPSQLPARRAMPLDSVAPG